MLIRMLVSGAVVTAGLMLATPAQAATAPPAPPAPAAGCADVDVVVARGTQEPGRFGSVVGDGVVQGILQQLQGRKSVSTYAVDYPAGIGFGSADLGREDLVRHVVEQAAACPAQSFVLSGYSQGATVVNTALGVRYGGWLFARPSTVIPAELAPRVKAVLLFGNPFHMTGLTTTGTYAPRVLDVCREGDPACDLGGVDVPTHAGYRQNTENAATFAVRRLFEPTQPAVDTTSASLPQVLDGLFRSLTAP